MIVDNNFFLSTKDSFIKIIFNNNICWRFFQLLPIEKNRITVKWLPEFKEAAKFL